MTEPYLKNITPDSLSGLIFGFQGIRNALVILNGPTGCKFYHSITAENQSVEKDDYDTLNWPDEWFFGQRRVPCTYLDKRDYVYGSEDKLRDAVREVLSRVHTDVLAVVNSPGAALIGDDLERIVRGALTACGYIVDQNPNALWDQNRSDKQDPTTDRGHKGTPDKLHENAADKGADSMGSAENSRRIVLITCQSPGWSRDIITGYREAARTVIDTFCKDTDGARGQEPEETYDQESSADNRSYSANGRQPSVNLLGLSIYQKYHAGDVAEIRRLFGLMGIRVNTALLCESTPDELRAVPDASLNVVIDPDWGLDSAEYLKEKFGTPYVVSEYGYPVGFKAMEHLILDVCGSISSAAPSSDHDGGTADTSCTGGKAEPDIAAVSPQTALIELERARAKAYVHLARISSLTGLPKGTRFSVFGDPALKRGYSAFLTEYLGMRNVENGFDDQEDPRGAENDGCGGSQDGRAAEPCPEIVLADGNTIARMKAEGKRFSGIEISLPSIGYIDVIDKTHLGAAGGLFLIEQILNSFRY